MYEAFGRGDAETVLGGLAEDVDWREAETQPCGGVVALGRYTGRRKESDKQLNAQFAHVWTVRDGEVKRFQQYTDTAQMSRILSE